MAITFGDSMHDGLVTLLVSLGFAFLLLFFVIHAFISFFSFCADYLRSKKATRKSTEPKEALK
jgi:hypothetical protein